MEEQEDKKIDIFTKLITFLNLADCLANENANDLYKQYEKTNMSLYEQERKKQYLENTHFLYEGYNYKILKVDGLYIHSKRLGLKPKYALSGRKTPRKEIFGITSNMDKLAVLYKKGER